MSEEEPLAYLKICYDMDNEPFLSECHEDYDIKHPKSFPVYKHPPKRKPLSEDAKRLQKELTHIKANNENLKERNRILRLRPDLPVDRLPYIKRLDELEEENKALKERIDSGIRVTASKYPDCAFEIHAQTNAVYRDNAILIIDDGVQL